MPRKGQQPLTLKAKILLILGLVVTTLLIIAIPLICVQVSKSESQDDLSPEQIVNRALEAMPIIDGHNGFPATIQRLANNDLLKFDFNSKLNETPPWSNESVTDIPRLLEGKVGGVFWTIDVPCDSQNRDAVALTLEQLDVMHRLVEMYEDLEFADSSEGLEAAIDNGKIASLLGISSGHSLQSNVFILRMYYKLGVRLVSLASDCNTPWSDSSAVAAAPSHKYGLSSFGYDIIKEMNRLGMIIDLSYASRQTMLAALQASRSSKAPLIFSRSAAASLCPFHQNLDDDVLQLVNLTSSLVMVPVDTHALQCLNATNATLDGVAAHIDYIRNKTSVNNVGIGTNFEGFSNQISGLEDATKLPKLLQVLVNNHDWSRDDLEKLAGRNFLRVFQAVEKVKDDLSTINPFSAHISPNDLVNHNVSLPCLSLSVP